MAPPPLPRGEARARSPGGFREATRRFHISNQIKGPSLPCHSFLPSRRPPVSVNPPFVLVPPKSLPTSGTRSTADTHAQP